MTLRSILEKEFFPFVVRPARYQGNEWGTLNDEKNTQQPTARTVALVVPDKYDRGMCLPELQLVYNYFRTAENTQCERVFAPDLDAEELLLEKQIPLFSLESQTALREFDYLLFLISGELSATAVLSILRLSQLPLLAADRSRDDPQVVAFPTKQINLLPLKDHFDFLVSGDVLKVLAAINSGEELPSESESGPDWEGLLREHQFSHSPIIPFEDVVQDRLVITVPRTYDPAELAQRISAQVAGSGYEEFSLKGDIFRFGDNFKQLCNALSFRFHTDRVTCLLPALPPNVLELEHFEKLAFGRKRSLRFFIGAGSDYLREALGLFFDTNNFFELLANAFSRGWRSIRLEFFVGLPHEVEADLRAIADIIETTEQLGYEYGEKHSVHATLNPFIPRPYTKWQWDEILSVEEYERRCEWVKQKTRKRNTQIRTPSLEMAVIEGLLSRGGAHTGDVIRTAYESGARFDSWQEHLSYGLWEMAFAENGIDIKEISRRRSFSDKLEFIGNVYGISTAELQEQRKNTFPQQRERKPGHGFLLDDIVLSRPDVAEQILTPRSTEKRSFGRKPKRVTQSGPMAVPRSRVRLQWRKGDEVRHVGHLACMKTFERAIRRARIPVEYTQGQQPRQKASLGPPLALGYTSDAEYFDLHLERPWQVEFLNRLNQELPAGFSVVQAKPVFGKVASISSQINLAYYDVEIHEELGVSELDVARILDEDSIVISRKRGEDEKEVDVRPAIIDLSLKQTNSGRKRLEMALGLGNLGFVRPDEILSQCLNVEEEKVLPLKIHRRTLLVVEGERRLSPFEVS